MAIATAIDINTGEVTLLDIDSVSESYSAPSVGDTATIGDIIQYKGATNENYTNGYFYKYTQETVSEATEEHIDVTQRGINNDDIQR